MKKLIVPDAETVVLALQDEIRRSEDSRYDHRLHGLLLVAQGMSAREAALLLGDAPRTAEYWVRRFEERGLAGIMEGERCGRPSRLSKKDLALINTALRKRPTDYELAGNLWDGKTLSAFIRAKCGIALGVRQCQRLFRQLGFRLRKPRPVIATADPDAREAVKKTASPGRKRRR